MKKTILLLLLLPLPGFSQETGFSEPSKFIQQANYVQINMNENERAVFKSGFGETVSFYPSEIIDLKENKKLNGLAVESEYIIKDYQHKTSESTKETAWIGIDEIPDLITWFENYVVPNLEPGTTKNKTVKYIFNSKEVELKFESYNNIQTFSVLIKNSIYKDEYFWTVSRVKEIPNIVKTLKYLQSKGS
jgi:hypothetical protein